VDDSKQTAQRMLIKNKLLFIFCMFLIMTSLFMTCYLFFFRTVTIDVTKNAKITYDGESGSANVSVINDDHNLNQRTQEFLDSITYQVTPKTNLSNGTIITITALYDENLASKYHIQVVNKTKTVTVEGLVERFGDISQMGDDVTATLDAYANRYFEKNMQTILQEDFSVFLANSERTMTERKRCYRVFLQALDRSNKDKIVDIYRIKAKGTIKQTKDHEAIGEQEVTLYYLLTYDDINTSKKWKDENVYGEAILHQEVKDEEELKQVLHQKYLLSYRFTVME